MNYELMDIEDFNAIKFANDIKKSRGLQACNNYKKCMFELRAQSENSFLLSELDHALNKVIRLVIAPDGTPTLFTLKLDNGRIYKYMVNNHKWTRKRVTEKELINYE